MKNGSRLASVIMVAMLLTSLVLGCQSSESGGQKPGKILLGVITDASGPYAAVAGPTLNAFQDAVAYVNDRGGVDGVPLEVVVRDGAGKADLATSMYTELMNMSPRPQMLFLVVSTYGEALHDRIAEDKIPTIATTSPAAIYPRAFTFGWYSLYTDWFGMYIDWLAKTWKGSQPPKLAFLTWNTSFGRSVLTPEDYDYAKSKGVNIVAEEVFAATDLDVTTQLVRIREKGADWIYSSTTANGPVVILKGLKQIGYNIPIAGNTGFDWSVASIAGKELMEGSVAALHTVSWDETDHEGVKAMAEYFSKANRSPKDRTVLYPMGFAGVLLAQEVIGKAVASVGWDKLSGEAIKAQILKTKDFSPLGLQTFSYSEDRYTPTKLRMYKWTDGKALPVSDWMDAPDLRPAQYK